MHSPQSLSHTSDAALSMQNSVYPCMHVHIHVYNTHTLVYLGVGARHTRVLSHDSGTDHTCVFGQVNEPLQASFFLNSNVKKKQPNFIEKLTQSKEKYINQEAYLAQRGT